MKERDFQSLFSAWIKQNKTRMYNLFGDACAFELKISKSKSIRFDSVSEHQRIALTEVLGEGCYHKINDMPFIKDNPMYRFTNKKPFDCFFISHSPSFVVVFFYKKGQKSKEREMIFIPSRIWFKLQDKNEKKSITEQELKRVGLVEPLIIKQ